MTAPIFHRVERKNIEWNDDELEELERQIEARRPSFWKDFKADPIGIIFFALMVVGGAWVLGASFLGAVLHHPERLLWTIPAFVLLVLFPLVASWQLAKPTRNDKAYEAIEDWYRTHKEEGR
jgi:hypothetical protein